MRAASIATVALALISLVHAQANSSTSSSAAQTLGAQNTQMLKNTLSMLRTNLNRLSGMLAENAQLQNRSNVSETLSAIHSSLLTINGTVALLSNRTQGVVQSNPKLPNTGGGGAKNLR